MANVMDVNESNFQEEVIESRVPVLVDFWAPWCGYCTRLSPILDDVADEAANRMKVAKVNVDENRNIAQQFGVMSLPTMILIKNGEPVEKLMGFSPKATIMSKVSPHL